MANNNIDRTSDSHNNVKMKRLPRTTFLQHFQISRKRTSRRQRSRCFIVLLLFFTTLLLYQYVQSGILIENDSLSSSSSTLPRSVLIITAHPDDEVMFFAPTILSLVSVGVQVFSLCLSIGNADSLGVQRKTELVDSFQVLGVPSHHVEVFNDSLLQDGFNSSWSSQYISQLVIQHIDSLSISIDSIISFDSVGISSHPNHISCFKAITLLNDFQKNPPPFKAVYRLQSLSVYTKFLSLPSAIFEHLMFSKKSRIPTQSFSSSSFVPPTSFYFLSSPKQYFQSLKAMRQHGSQLVWFRYFYLVLSRYMYSNRLVLL